MPELTQTAEGWARILADDPAALGPYSDWLEGEGFPLLAGQVRALPALVQSMQDLLAPLRLDRDVRGIRLCLQVGPGEEPCYFVRFTGMAYLPGGAATTPYGCRRHEPALAALLIGLEHRPPHLLSPLRAWLEALTGWRLAEVRGRIHGVGYASTAVLEIPARKENP